MSNVRKVVIGLFALIVIVTGGLVVYAVIEEQAKQEACANLHKEEEYLARSLSASNVRFDGSKIRARVTNNASDTLRGKIKFRIVTRDCLRGDCVVIERSYYDVPYITIPSGEARDVIGTRGLFSDSNNTDPQGDVRYSYTVEVDLGGYNSSCW